MSLILCRMEPVRHPFEIPELGIRIHSSQELCYVIYENPLLVMDDFVDYRLIQFIQEDLGMEFLAGKLENWKKSGENPDNLLLLILSECQYYTTTEVTRYRQRLIQMRKKHPADYWKEKADYLAERKQYGKAIPLYEKLLEMEKDRVVNDMFLSRVWICLGACQARMFQFEKACHSYEKAYACNTQNKEIPEQIYYLKAFFPELVLSQRCLDMLEDADQEAWEANIAVARKKGEGSEKVKEPDELFSKDPVKRLAGAAVMVQQWKQEYRGMI